MRRALVLCSGGMKSNFLARLAKKEGEVFLFFSDHGQPNCMQEEASVIMLARTYGYRLFRSKVEQGADSELLQFLWLVLRALPIARAQWCQYIYHGLSRDDSPGIITNPHNIEPFVKGLQTLLSLTQPLYDEHGGWLGEVEIETPLRHLHMHHVVRLGNEWRIPWEDTWSCVHPGRVHCGTCYHCVRRKQAFETEGSEDLTVYAE